MSGRYVLAIHRDLQIPRTTGLAPGGSAWPERVRPANTRIESRALVEQLWIGTLEGRMPFGKVIVAIANKHARQTWAILAHDVDYAPRISRLGATLGLEEWASCQTLGIAPARVLP